MRQDIVARFGDKWTEAGNLVANGPFTLGEWAHDQRLVLVPNPNFYGDKASEKANTWIAANGADVEKALMEWDGKIRK